MHEHPLHRFFKSKREQPIFQWERFQQRDVLVIDPAATEFFSNMRAPQPSRARNGNRRCTCCAPIRRTGGRR